MACRDGLKIIVFVMLCATFCSPAGAVAQTLDPSDLAQMHKTYDDNEVRYKRDYVGKTFSGVLPFKSAVDQAPFKPGTYSVGFGNGLIIPDIECGGVSKQPTLNQIVNWHKGDKIRVTGVVTGHTLGHVDLEQCVFER